MKVLPRSKTPSTLAWAFNRVACGLLVFLATTVAHGQSYQVIRSFGLFNEATGSAPLWKLVQGPDGALYGTTSSGALTLKGSVFKVRPDGTGFAVLKLFTNAPE